MSQSLPANTPPADAPKNRVSAKAAGIVGLAVMFSRVLGLVREQVCAALFGVSFQMDAFVAAFRIPNLLRDLFAEGALSTAFIAIFSKKIVTEGEGSAWQLANKIATLAVVFMSGVTLLGIAFAPQITAILTTGFSPEKMELTASLTRIMFPFILLISLSALSMGILNSKNVFGMPALASSFFNLGSILGGVGFGYWLDPTFGPKAIVGLAMGTLLGGLLQLLVQFPSLRKVGFRFRPDFRWCDSGVREVILLMIPAVIAASAVQVNVMVNTNFASHLGDGAMSILGYAFRLMLLPLGVFGVAVGTVTLPVVSRFASVNDLDGVRNSLARGLRLGALMTIPSSVGLIFFAEPIIALIYHRGKFDFTAMQATAEALRYYAVGLAAYSGIKVVAPAFYAMGKRTLPMYVSFFSILVNYGLNHYITFYLDFGYKGLALCTGLVAIINFTILYLLMVKYAQGLHSRTFCQCLLKLAVASLPLALVCYLSQQWYFTDLAQMGLLMRGIGVFGTIFIAATLFYGTAFLLKIEELSDLTGIIRRKLKRA